MEFNNNMECRFCNKEATGGYYEDSQNYSTFGDGSRFNFIPLCYKHRDKFPLFAVGSMPRKTRIVVVAGGFDPLHLGHLEHLRKARLLGDWLIVITHPDEILIKKKGYCLLPLFHRVELLRELRCVNEVVVSIDEDGTVAKTLDKIRPDIFAKGGDRIPGNMPQNEIKVCERLGIMIRYGIGEKLASSQDLVRKAIQYYWSPALYDNYIRNIESEQGELRHG